MMIQPSQSNQPYPVLPLDEGFIRPSKNQGFNHNPEHAVPSPNKENDSPNPMASPPKKNSYKRLRDSNHLSPGMDSALGGVLKKLKASSPSALSVKSARNLCSPSQAGTPQSFYRKLHANQDSPPFLLAQPSRSPQFSEISPHLNDNDSPSQSGARKRAKRYAEMFSQDLSSQFEENPAAAAEVSSSQEKTVAFSQQFEENPAAAAEMSSSQEKTVAFSQQSEIAVNGEVQLPGGVIDVPASLNSSEEVDELILDLSEGIRDGKSGNVIFNMILIEEKIKSLESEIAKNPPDTELLNEMKGELEKALEEAKAWNPGKQGEHAEEVEEVVGSAKWTEEELKKVVGPAKWNEEELKLATVDVLRNNFSEEMKTGRVRGVLNCYSFVKEKIRLLEKQLARGQAASIAALTEEIKDLIKLFEDINLWLRVSVGFLPEEEIPLTNLDQIRKELFEGILERKSDVVENAICLIKREMRALTKGISLTDSEAMANTLMEMRGSLARILREAVMTVCKDPIEHLPIAQVILNSGRLEDRIWLEYDYQKNIFELAIVQAAVKGHVNIVQAIIDKFTLTDETPYFRKALLQAIKYEHVETAAVLLNQVQFTDETFAESQELVKSSIQRAIREKNDSLYGRGMECKLFKGEMLLEFLEAELKT